ncbi:hypothetical protein P879_08428 [Paragonimus westermani]|uniref:Uncharacterized protein n=1 Tax=Paragonimus westermani TaxID=34504 RepID=A0A8T0D3Q5_9TREM|nr:hypothetical protein P879_08428 [Paragonimus westermani]
MVSMREKLEASSEGLTDVFSEIASLIRGGNISVPVQHITVRKNVDIQHWDISYVSALDPCVTNLVDSRTWLSAFGLKVQHLKRSEVLRDIGFIVKEAFVPILGKYVKSSYSDGIFHKVQGSRSSKTYNIIANEGYLKQIENRLSSAVDLYRNRLEWLNTGSRNIFGVLQEHAVTVLIDIKNFSPQTFENFIKVVKCFVVDQIRKISQFNFIRCAEKPEWFSPVLVEVTAESIERVCNWLEHLDLLTNLTSNCTSECLSEVNSTNQNHEAIYLISEGGSCTCAPELLREQVLSMRHPLHIVSYECSDVPSLNYMASLCRHTGGR